MVFIAADSRPQWSWVNPKINEWVLVLWRLLGNPSSTWTLQFSSRTPHNQAYMQHRGWFWGGPTWSQQLDSTFIVGPFQLGILYSYRILHAKWKTALTWEKKNQGILHGRYEPLPNSFWTAQESKLRYDLPLASPAQSLHPSKQRLKTWRECKTCIYRGPFIRSFPVLKDLLF